jgi:ADP-ribosylglycohydrolase
MCISAIAGDIIGSAFEFDNKRKNTYTSLFSDKSDFTDDTVLTIATADAILNNRPYGEVYYEYAVRYPDRGYGKSFADKVASGKLEPYDSYGNGSAMRISPVAWAFSTEELIFEEAKKSAECTHNHIEGVRGAQSIAYAIWLCKNLTTSGNRLTKDQILHIIEEKFGYDLKTKTYDFEKKFDVTCQGTIPRCFAIFNESNDFESAMRLSISMGGDVDTNCCIVGGLLDAYCGLPSKDIIQAVYERLPKEMSDITTRFVRKFIDPSFEPPLFEPKPSTMNSILSLTLEET